MDQLQGACLKAERRRNKTSSSSRHELRECTSSVRVLLKDRFGGRGHHWCGPRLSLPKTLFGFWACIPPWLSVPLSSLQRWRCVQQNRHLPEGGGCAQGLATWKIASGSGFRRRWRPKTTMCRKRLSAHMHREGTAHSGLPSIPFQEGRTLLRGSMLLCPPARLTGSLETGPAAQSAKAVVGSFGPAFLQRL